jgi:hypothetical protein
MAARQRVVRRIVGPDQISCSLLERARLEELVSVVSGLVDDQVTTKQMTRENAVLSSISAVVVIGVTLTTRTTIPPSVSGISIALLHGMAG